MSRVQFAGLGGGIVGGPGLEDRLVGLLGFRV